MIKKFKDLPTNYKSALVIFIALVLWIASGILKSDNNIATVKTTEAEKIISVRATDVVAEDKIYYLTIRGRTEAENKVIKISDPDAREHIYGIPYSEWKEKYRI